ncbi:MAG: lysylphosphatidylglycerol synthase transmembrane domain-containing protein [Planctomycetota bacterium]
MANKVLPPPSSDAPPGRGPLWMVKLGIRGGVLALVAWGIWRTVRQAGDELPAYGVAWGDVSLTWTLVAGLLYIAGLLPCWVFWHRTLRAMEQRPRWRESLRAFWIGHLGKYVPGKAMVVVLRAGLIHSERVNRTVAATSVFIETLTMMAVGAFVSSVVLLLISDKTWLTLLAAGLMACSGIPTFPPIFRRLVRTLQVKRANPQIETAILGVGYPLMITGWISIAAGWLLMGVSLWATLWSLGSEPPLSDIPLLTATVGLAMVAGFLSLIPGGLGVRDWILVELLAPGYGRPVALGSAILLRVIWLLAEVAASGILYVDVWWARRAARSLESRPG